jgi:hypothetical protein
MEIVDWSSYFQSVVYIQHLRREEERRSAMKKGKFVIFAKRGGCENLMVPGP